MIFEDITLENLGAFRGVHSIALAPPNSSRPIVLVGALNGSGKTTIIEALQLVLYGRRAAFGWRGFDSYGKYITELRNRHARSGESMSVSLTVRLAGDRVLRVRRLWSFEGKGPKEYLSVAQGRDGLADKKLTDDWDEEIERILPAKLSELFFFDGERIEQLADPTRGAAVMRTAFAALLGIDLVDSLIADLEIVRRNQKKSLMSHADLAALGRLEEEDKQIASNESLLADEAGQLEVDRDTLLRTIEDLRERLRRQGNERFKVRDKIANALATGRSELRAGQDRLREIASRSLPLALLIDQLSDLRERTLVKVQLPGRNECQLALSELEGIRQWLKSQKGADATVRSALEYIDTRIAQIRDRCVDVESGEPRHLLVCLERLLDVSLPEAIATSTMVRKSIGASAHAATEAERALLQLPAEEQLAGVHSELARAEASLSAVSAELDRVKRDRGALLDQRRSVESERRSLFDRQVEAGDARRISEYCVRSRETLRAFRAKLVAQRRAQLERLIVEAFQLLVRKPDLIANVTIDAASLAISIEAPDGALLSPEQLSAGERQLFAVATLWGLAKAAGRQIPVVIDTPLGRLDSTHRASVVNKYFPGASHQVILLSTDEEVDAEMSASLDQAIGYRYLISYDHEAKSSAVTVGYF